MTNVERYEDWLTTDATVDLDEEPGSKVHNPPQERQLADGGAS
jgi:hypothetical protein